MNRRRPHGDEDTYGKFHKNHQKLQNFPKAPNLTKQCNRHYIECFFFIFDF